MKNTLLIVALLSIINLATAQKTDAWRGTNGTGVYPDKNLMKSWPEAGPKKLWVATDLGAGHSSPVFANGKIYLTTLKETTGYLLELDMKGKVLRQVAFGEEWHKNWEGARSTPTIVKQDAYVLSSHGKLVCIDLAGFKIKWQKDIFKDFDGVNIQWGVTETLLVDGDKLYCAPGGKVNNVICLNRNNGELIWSSAGKGGTSAYCSPLMIEIKGRKFLITMMENNVLSIDAKTGKLVWSFEKKNKYAVHPNTPYYYNGELYCFSGYGSGGFKLSLSEDGTSVKKVWDNQSLDNQMGGAVVVDGYIYGSGQKYRTWKCLDWKTGEQKWESKEVGKGVVISADGMLICYSDKGELALAKADPTGFNITGRVKITEGESYHWSHPVIHKGILYLRHGSALIAFDITAR